MANPIPDSYRRITPCLVVQGAAKALDFYAEVFGATERMRFSGPDGAVAGVTGVQDRMEPMPLVVRAMV